MSFHGADCDLQGYRHLQSPYTYDVIDTHYDVLRTEWSQKLFSSIRERLILLPVKFQLHIIVRSTNFEHVTRGGGLCEQP